MREVQRQQAIQDLEALLQPGALEARIQQVCVFFILRIVVCVNISKIKNLKKLRQLFFYSSLDA